MKRINAGNWDELHSRMLLGEGLGGAIILAFQAFLVAGLIFG
jgi:hypothetical protein